MKPELIEACECFSRGDTPVALPLIDEGVEWYIVGDHTIVGKAGVEQTCAEALAEGRPLFENARTLLASDFVIVEGSDPESDIHYCDIYEIKNDLIIRITSYCLTALDS